VESKQKHVEKVGNRSERQGDVHVDQDGASVFFAHRKGIRTALARTAIKGAASQISPLY
jgi:hypothetical protein